MLVGARQDVQASAEALCVRVSHYEARERARALPVAPAPVSLGHTYPSMCSTHWLKRVAYTVDAARAIWGRLCRLGRSGAHTLTRQVYNECLYDLLDEASVGGLGPRPRLQVKEDAHSRVFVAGLSEARARAPGQPAPAMS